MASRANSIVLRVIIAVLALGDGVLHLSLDWILFRGNLFGSGRPPGPSSGTLPPRTGTLPARPVGNPFILPLNELFVLNFAGEVVLVALFLYSRRLLGERRWIVDVLMIVFAAATFIGWLIYGRPNPMGLGYLARGMEIVLIIALLVDLWSIFRPRVAVPAAA